MQAAKHFFDQAPSVWNLACFVAPSFLMPFIRLLAAKFPSKINLKKDGAIDTLCDASVNLIKVSTQTLLVMLGGSKHFLQVVQAGCFGDQLQCIISGPSLPCRCAWHSQHIPAMVSVKFWEIIMVGSLH